MAIERGDHNGAVAWKASRDTDGDAEGEEGAAFASTRKDLGQLLGEARRPARGRQGS
jgi:hypothetical protein